MKEITALVNIRKNIPKQYNSEFGEVFFSYILDVLPRKYEELFSERELIKIRRLYRNQIRVRALVSGRILIKNYYATQFKKVVDLRRIEILNSEDGLKGYPQVFINGTKINDTISISYSENYVSVAICHNQRRSIGTDLEIIKPFSNNIFNMFFTPKEIDSLEQNIIADEDSKYELQTVYWCIKESLLKAIRIGFSDGAGKIQVVYFNNQYVVSVDDNRLGIDIKDISIDVNVENGICQVNSTMA